MCELSGRCTDMNATTNNHESDRYFVALANERLGQMDVAGARRLARQLDGTSRLRRIADRLHARRAV